jgi:hypothetical protein
VTAQSLYDAVHISLLVIKMEKIVPHKKVTLKGKVLRILGMDKSLKEPASYQEITHAPIPIGTDYSNPKERLDAHKAALLEAERRKSEALMEWQRHRIF